MATGSPYAAQPPQPPERKSNTMTILAIVLGVVLVFMLVCGGVLVALLLPAVQSARHAARRMQSSNNLKQIGLALHNYHDTYQAFPPAYTTDADGQPLLSWRVIILPYVEQLPLYEQFHLDEPWDSPHNLALLDQMPPLYRSPLASEAIPANESQYFTIRAPNSIFPGTQQIHFRDIIDGTSNTAAVMELSTMGVPWSKPDDITPAAAYAAFTQMTPTDGGNVLLADAAVRFIASDIDQQTFMDMVGRNDSQPQRPSE